MVTNHIICLNNPAIESESPLCAKSQLPKSSAAAFFNTGDIEMKKLYYLSICLTLSIAIVALLLFYSNQTSAENLPAFQTEGARNGIKEIVLNSAAGKVRISLPDDIRPGDTISGTVSAEPKGETKDEIYKNSAELMGTVVEIAGARQNTWEKVGEKLQSTIKFVLTAGTAPTGLLKSAAGTPISNFNVPVSSIGITTPQVSSPTPEDFKLPVLGQTGRPVQIHGPFDGNFDNTSVKVGNQPAQLLAESPRKAVFKSPENVTGQTEMAMKEGNVAATGRFRNVGVNLSAPKTNLMKGEKTTITVAVSGLEGITGNIPVTIVTTGTVNMQGGNMQNILITPSQVGSTGAYTQKFGLTALQAGGFSVVATVLADPQQEQARCKCTCELNDPPIIGAGRDKIKGGGTTYSYKASIKTAKCEGENCTVSTTTYSWSVVAADSTATYTVQDASKTSDKFKVDVTASGTLTVTVTVTVTCSDGSKCSDTKTKTFDVKK